MHDHDEDCAGAADADADADSDFDCRYDKVLKEGYGVSVLLPRCFEGSPRCSVTFS